MKKLNQLLHILQLTKEQPLTGFLAAGLKLSETETLAEHHYGCLLMAYLLAAKIKKAGGIINERKLILMVMFHDLGELFGGDVAGPLNRKYPDLCEHKDAIGVRAVEMLSGFMDKEPSEEIKNLFEEFEFGNSDEHWVGKIVDQMDHQFYLEKASNHLSNNPDFYGFRKKFVREHIFKMPENIKDEKTKKVMVDFLSEFDKNHFTRGYQAMNFLMASEQDDLSA